MLYNLIVQRKSLGSSVVGGERGRCKQEKYRRTNRYTHHQENINILIFIDIFLYKIELLFESIEIEDIIVTTYIIESNYNCDPYGNYEI